MQTERLKVQMLGGLTLQWNGGHVDDDGGRSRKVWLLIAYMIYHRSRPITPAELCTLLWEGEERSTNPRNALKTMFHRARAFLNRMDGASAGHELILRQEGGYAWNTQIPITLDVEEFHRLAQAGNDAPTPEAKLSLWGQALALYKGPFLAKLAYEPWVAPIATRCHDLYIRTALKCLTLLESQSRWEDIVPLCHAVLDQDPYLEEIYTHLVRALLRLEQYDEAVSAYEGMSDLLQTSFGVTASEELLSLYREAIRSANGSAASSGTILGQLKEPPDLGGCLICSYDFFKAIYRAMARSMERSGDAVHLALITLKSISEKELSKRSLERAVSNLQEIIRTRLRRGDVVARCSDSQFVCLLPQANYENTWMICQRLEKAFSRQYPHSPVKLHSSVHPVEPNHPA